MDIALFSYCHDKYKTLDSPGSWINLHSNRKIPVVLLSADSFDPLSVDVTTVTLGDPLLDGTCQPEGSDSWDVNQDGLPDVVLHFSASLLAEARALSVESTEVELKSETVDGQSILHTAPVEVKDL